MSQEDLLRQIFENQPPFPTREIFKNVLATAATDFMLAPDALMKETRGILLRQVLNLVNHSEDRDLGVALVQSLPEAALEELMQGAPE